MRNNVQTRYQHSMTCFRLQDRSPRFVLLLICLVSAFGATAAARAQDATQDLIQQLASPQFVTRSIAAEKLQQLGAKAEPELTKALESDNAEIAFQARSILQRLKFGNVALTEDEQSILRRLEGCTTSQQIRILQDRRQMRLDFLMQILEMYPQLAEKFLSGNASRFNDLLNLSIKSKKWEEVQRIMQHPLVIQHTPSTCYHYHHAMGDLDDFVNQQLQTLRAQVEAGQRPSVQQINSMLAMLRIQNRYTDAVEVLKWLPVTLSDRATRQVRIESGNWEEVAAALIDPANKRLGDGKIAANEVQRALVYSVAGQQEKIDAIVAKIEEERRQAEQEGQTLKAQFAQSRLLTIGVISLDWDLVKSFLDQKKSLQNFQVMTQLSRYEEAFAAIQLGDSFSQRKAWFTEQFKQFARIKRDLESLRKGSPEYAQGIRELSDIRELLISVIDELGMLGFNEECDLYAQKLFMADEGNFNTRNRLIVILLTQERFETLWGLIQNGLTKSNTNTMSQQLFSEQFSRVLQLYTTVRQYHSEPIEQIKVMATLTQSPLAAASPYQFDIELARFRTQLNGNLLGRNDVLVAELLELNGRTDESRQLYLECMKHGDPIASRNVYYHAFREEQYSKCVHYFDSMWTSGNYYPILSSECYRQMIRKESDPKQAAAFRSLAQQSKFSAATAWRSQRHSNEDTVRELNRYGVGRLSLFLAKSRCFALDGAGADDLKFRPTLIDLLTQHEPASGAIQRVAAAFDLMEIGSFESQGATTWIHMAHTLQMELAKLEIQQGQIARATDRLMRCTKFHPVNTSIAEEIIPLLDAAGASQQADSLFALVSQDYANALSRFPNSSLLRNNYAWTCTCANRNMSSVYRHIEIALKARPHNASYLDTMATIRFLQGDVDEALKLNAQAISLRPFRTFYREQRTKFLKAQNAAKSTSNK